MVLLIKIELKSPEQVPGADHAKMRDLNITFPGLNLMSPGLNTGSPGLNLVSHGYVGNLDFLSGNVDFRSGNLDFRSGNVDNLQGTRLSFPYYINLSQITKILLLLQK